MKSAADQLKRLLTLIPHVADGNARAVADVAAIVGVTAEELVADLGSLTDRYNAPGGFVDGVQIFFDGEHVSVTTQHFNRPMRLTMAELCALELGLAMLVRERPPDEVAPVARALENLRRVITNIPGDDKLAGLRSAELGGAGVPPEWIALLRKAVRERRKMRVVYRKGSATESEQRVVRPYTMAYTNGMWYLVGFCEREQKLCFFRLDRMEDVVRAGSAKAFEVPADFGEETLFRKGKPFVFAEGGDLMLVKYGAKVARWIAEREGRELESDGTLTVERPLLDDAWAVRHVLQYGADAEVLEPKRVRDLVLERLRAMA